MLKNIVDFSMNDYVNGIKILSNMIVISFVQNDIFKNTLTTYITKNFSSTMILRHSTFIFFRDGEVLRRKIFLNWMHNLYSKSNKDIKKDLLDSMINNQKLTICLQSVEKSKLVETVRLFAYFLGNRILFRSLNYNEPFFAYMKMNFKTESSQIKHDGCNLYFDLSSCNYFNIEKVKRAITQKTSIAGKTYILLYNQKDFELFFARFGTSNDAHSSNNRNYQNRYND